MVPSYGPLETKQLLSETFFSPELGFRDIRLDGLKWVTLYILFNLRAKLILQINKKENQYILCTDKENRTH